MDTLFKILFILIFILVVGFAIFEISVFIYYRNTPVSELPTWAAWLLFDK